MNLEVVPRNLLKINGLSVGWKEHLVSFYYVNITLFIDILLIIQSFIQYHSIIIYWTPIEAVRNKNKVDTKF